MLILASLLIRNLLREVVLRTDAVSLMSTNVMILAMSDKQKRAVQSHYYCSETQHNALPEQRQKITYWNLCHDCEQTQEYPMQYENMFKRMKNQITKENDNSNVLGSYDCGS